MSVQCPADSEKHISSLFALLPSVHAVFAVVPLEYRAALFCRLKDFISEVLKPSGLVCSRAVPLAVPLGVCSKKFSTLNAGLKVELVARAISVVFQKKKHRVLAQAPGHVSLRFKSKQRKKKDMQMLFVGLPVP